MPDKYARIFIIISFILSLLIVPINTLSADFEIMKVVEVGPCTGEPELSPLRWSPDGKYVAYFYNHTLMLSDSLGNTSTIKKFENTPRRFEWLSDKEIVIHFYDKPPSPGQNNELIRIDITTKEAEVLLSFQLTRGARLKNQENSFSGPFLTAEGHLYIRTNVIRSTLWPAGKGYLNENIMFVPSKYAKKNDTDYSKTDHIAFWEKDGIYMSKADFSDLRKLGSRSKHPIQSAVVLNHDYTHYMVDWLVCSVADTSCLYIYEYMKDQPPDTYLPFPRCYSFNPKMPEILMDIVFPISENTETWRTGIFNYETQEFTMLDNAINIFSIWASAYCPDGRKIAFRTVDGTLYILYRTINEPTD